MKNIIVTGSKGTIGTPLVKELRARGYKVTGIDLTHSEDLQGYLRADVTKIRQLEKAFTEAICGSNAEDVVVYHLAAEFGRHNGEEFYENLWTTNVIGTRNVLELQRRFGCIKLIYASSSEVYGEMDVPELKEHMMPPMQHNDYAITKWVNEIQCKNFRERYNSPISVLRFFNAYGPGEYFTPYRSVVCQFIYRMLKNMPIAVYEGYHRVFMYIDDFIPTLANACGRFDEIEGLTINIGGKEYRSVSDLYDVIKTFIPEHESIVARLSEDMHNVVNKRPDIGRAMAALGHNPIVTLEEGIEETVAWMKTVI
jgi:dTDP-glucose 4,6-dehydratase